MKTKQTTFCDIRSLQIEIRLAIALPVIVFLRFQIVHFSVAHNTTVTTTGEQENTMFTV